MDRCALFVDAGYVLADGAMAVHGTRRRESVSWDYEGLLRLLASLASERSGLPLLRCYWYDATVEGRRGADHDVLADLPGVKLRLAKMRPGRREGVESEIHRDLTALARNKAVTDAMVVSAEEDLAEVIADVQDLGMRVTMLHILVDGNWTISRALRQECDDTVEINAAHLRPYVELISGAEPSQPEEQAVGSLVPLRPAGGQAPGGQPAAARAAQYAALPAGSGNGYRVPQGGYPEPGVAEYQRSIAQLSRQRPDEPAARNANGPAGEEGKPAGVPAPAARQDAPARQDMPARQEMPGRQEFRQDIQQIRPEAQPAQAPSHAPAGPVLRAAQSQAPARQGMPERQGAPDRQDMPEARDPRQDYPAASSLAGTAHPDLPPARQDRLAAYPEQHQVRRDFAGPQDAPGGRTDMPASADMTSRPDIYAGPIAVPLAQDEWSGELASPRPQQDLSGYIPGGAREPRGRDPLPREAQPREASPREVQAQEAQLREGLARDMPSLRAMPGGQGPADEAMHALVPVVDSGTAQVRRLPSRGPDGGGPAPSDPAASSPAGTAPAYQGGYGPGRAPSYSDPVYGGDAPYGDSSYPDALYGEASYSGQQPADFGGQSPMTGLAPGIGPVPVPGAANGAGPAGMTGPAGRGDPTGPMAQPAVPGAGAGSAVPAGPAGAGPAGAAGLGGMAAGQPQSAVSLADAVQSAHEEGQEFGSSVARDAPALWLEAVLARKPRMPSDLEARLLQGSALPIDFLLHDEVRHALRRGFWDALERARR